MLIRLVCYYIIIINNFLLINLFLILVVVVIQLLPYIGQVYMLHKYIMLYVLFNSIYYQSKQCK